MKKLLIDATGSENWIGGLYYKKNILYSILRNENITKKTSIIVVTDNNIDIFDCFSKAVKIVKMKSKYRRLKIFILSLMINVDYYFPYSTSYDNGEMAFKKIGVQLINWIPDFQHKYYPLFFSNEEINKRDVNYKKQAEDSSDLVLSSNDCKKDFAKFYNSEKKNVFVVPFVSYIEPIIRALDKKDEAEIINKFLLDNSRYACIMNQFWQHKNHKVVLDAMRFYFQKYPESNFKFVFTGKLEDYRCPQYINELKSIFNEDIIKRHSVLLGFIDRIDQIAIMKNAEFIIQPSLFEGWGTVVEDAKVLDKTILLSDIPVHREQMNEKCILFDPHNSEELAELIQQECHKEHHDNIEKGIEDMKKRALEYSKGFEQLLRDQEKKS